MPLVPLTGTIGQTAERDMKLRLFLLIALSLMLGWSEANAGPFNSVINYYNTAASGGTACTGTIGEDSGGVSTSDPGSTSFVYIMREDLACGGTPATIHAEVLGGHDYRLAVYADNGSGAPGSLIWQTAESTAQAGTLVDLSVAYGGPAISETD